MGILFVEENAEYSRAKFSTHCSRLGNTEMVPMCVVLPFVSFLVEILILAFSK